MSDPRRPASGVRDGVGHTPGARTAGLARPAEWLPLALLLAFFALVYSADLGRARMFMWDESEYAHYGRSVLRGQGISIYGQPDELRPPVLPISLAAGLALAPHGGDATPRAVVLVWALLAIALTWAATRSSHDRPTALIAAAMLGAMPLYQVHATLVLTEIPYLAAFTAAVWQLRRALAGRRDGFVPCGVAIAIAVLTRYTALLFLPIALVMAAVTAVAVGPREFVRRTLRTREYWLGKLAFVLVVAPWLWREYRLFHDPLAGLLLAARLVPTWAAMPWHEYLTRLPLMAGWPMAALALIGLLVSVRGRDALGGTALLVFAVVVGWHSHYPYKEDRFVSSMLPFLAMLAAIGLTRGVGVSLARFARPPLPAWITGAIAVLALGVVLGGGGAERLVQPVQGYPSLTEALDDLAAVSPRDSVVIGASGPQISWYADRLVHPFPDSSEDMPDALEGASWVVFVNFERMQPAWATDLTALVGPAEAAAGVVRVHRSGPYQTLLVRAPWLAARLADSLAHEARGPAH